MPKNKISIYFYMYLKLNDNNIQLQSPKKILELQRK